MSNRPPIVWHSLFFPDFVYLNDADDAPPYEEGLRRAFYESMPESIRAEVNDPKVWPLLRLERRAVALFDRLGLAEKIGTRIEEHTIRYMTLLIPELDPDPWFQEKVWAFYECRRMGRQTTNFFGGQNSGKTNFLASFSVAMTVAHPGFTRCTMSGPYKEAGDAPMWTEAELVFDSVKAAWGPKLSEWTGAIYDAKRKTWDGNANGTSILMRRVEGKAVLIVAAQPKSGTIKLVALDTVGKLQGAKAKDKRQQDGYIFVFLDEIGAGGYPTMALLKNLFNIRSNDNLQVFTACNPYNPIGFLDGELGRPSKGYESLNIDQDYVWNSAHNSRTYRFDGHQSPNLVLNDERWPWLFNRKRQAKLLSATVANSDDYNSQCRAFMGSGSGTKYVLTSADIRQGEVDKDFMWTEDEKWKVAFLDPALTNDGDKAMLCVLEGGTRIGIAGERTPTVFASRMIQLPIFTGLVADETWILKCRAIRGPNSPGNLILGNVIPVEEQLAINAAYECMREKIPFNQFGFDDSMRGNITVAMFWAMGQAPRMVSSIAAPESIPVFPPRYSEDAKGHKILVTWNDDCQKFVSQLLFFGAAVIRSGFFRCHVEVIPALSQMCARMWDYAAAGRKKLVETKKALKERNGGKSPDECDALCGALYIANKIGLLKLKIELPDATPHLTRQGFSTIRDQWRKRKQSTGLHLTGTR